MQSIPIFIQRQLRWSYFCRRNAVAAALQRGFSRHQGLESHSSIVLYDLYCNQKRSSGRRHPNFSNLKEKNNTPLGLFVVCESIYYIHVDVHEAAQRNKSGDNGGMHPGLYVLLSLYRHTETRDVAQSGEWGVVCPSPICLYFMLDIFKKISTFMLSSPPIKKIWMCQWPGNYGDICVNCS